VAVLWLVAALSILVSGVVYAVRGEIRNVSWQKELSVSTAIADAGAMLVARELSVSGIRDGLLRTYELKFEDRALRVDAIPLNGLVDLNAAPESLLADLLAVAGGVDRSSAGKLAQRIIDWRDPDNVALPSGAEDDAYVASGSRFRTRGANFESPEDLLQVLGIDFDVYLKISKLVTVEARGSGHVNPASAPLSVLSVLAGGDEELAQGYASARARDGLLADSTRFRADHQGSDVGSRFLIEARIGLSNGSVLVTRRFLDIGATAKGAPWTTMRIERTVEG